MKITIKGRGDVVTAPLEGHVSCGGGDIVAFFQSEAEAGSLTLSGDELAKLVVASAPFNATARARFFGKLMAAADRAYPPKPF